MTPEAELFELPLGTFTSDHASNGGGYPLPVRCASFWFRCAAQLQRLSSDNPHEAPLSIEGAACSNMNNSSSYDNSY